MSQRTKKSSTGNHSEEPGNKTDKHSQSLPKAGALLNPVERISEILFGMIMALSFTCSLSLAGSERADIRSMLFAVLGCNIAWGLVDAVMYTLSSLTERSRSKSILAFVRKEADASRARELIYDELPPLVADALGSEGIEKLRKQFQKIPEESLRVRLSLSDLKKALGVFLLVFLSTFPLALPFLLIPEPRLALRVSNGIAVFLMFTSGWLLARYGALNKLRTGLIMTGIGIILVALTISLGG